MSSASSLDVYRDWLGITEAARPLTHYQLLRLTQFEDDAAKIRANYRKLNAQARKYAAGQFGDQSQQLLNELAKAMLCLTDAQRKAEYDAALGRKAEVKAGRSLEEILIYRKALDAAALQKARNYALAVGVEIRDALVQQKLCTADVVLQAFAESIGLPCIDLNDIGIDEALVPKVPAVLARQNSCAPVMIDEGVLLMASPNPLNPNVEEEMRLRTGLPVRTVLCTALQINGVINKHFPKEAAAAELAAGGGRPGGKPAEAAVEKPKAVLTPEQEKKKQLAIAAPAIAFVLVGVVMLFTWEFTAAAGIQGSMPVLITLGCAAGAALLSFLAVKLMR